MFIYFVSMINRSVLYVVSKRCDVVGLEYLPVIIWYFFNPFFYSKSKLSFKYFIIKTMTLFVSLVSKTVVIRNACFPFYVECFANIFHFVHLIEIWWPKSTDIWHNKMKCLPYYRARTKLYCKIRKVITMFACFV